MTSIDVAILAGGRGERLRSVWTGAKCLVPVRTLHGEETVLGHLIRRSLALGPYVNVWCVLGYDYGSVLTWLEKSPWHGRVSWAVEEHPQGTASALRTLDRVKAPLMVLNGDTIPRYDLGALLQFWQTTRCEIAAAWCKGRYAGAAVLRQSALDAINAELELSDLNYFLGMAERYAVPGYLDCGTPEVFRQLQSEELS